MRNAARNTVLLRHTYNLVDLPIKVAGKSGHGRVRDPRRARAACRSTRGSSGSCPRTPRTARSTTTDSQLVVLAFAYDSRTKGNVATEIVKYFLQLHFGIKKDYRLPNLLKRGNFYQSN